MPVTRRDVTSLSKSGDAKLKGDVTLSEGSGVSITQSGQDIEIAATGGGSGDVTSSANIADNTIVRGDGGVKGVQDSGITISDTDSISGVDSLELSGDIESTDATGMTIFSGVAGADLTIGFDGDIVLNAGNSTRIQFFSSDLINEDTLDAGVTIESVLLKDGLVDGRDVATDGTKLDGIEAGADVTDTTNVTAAGALMDSEVTNLAAVKAFDPTDYATAAQGTLADSATQPGDNVSTLTNDAGYTTNTGDVTSSANITDNAIVRGDGGTKGVQGSGITISDAVGSTHTISTAGNIEIETPAGSLGLVADSGIYLEDTGTGGVFIDAIPTLELGSANYAQLVAGGYLYMEGDGIELLSFDTSTITTSGLDISAGTNHVNLAGNATNAAQLRLAETTTNGTNYVAISAPASATSNKTQTLQDVTGTIYVSGGTDIPVADGGTGASSLTSGNFLQGNGTSAVTATKAVPTGDVVGTSDTQTLTNKTLTTPTIAQINNSSAPGVKLQLRTQTDNSNSISSATTAGVFVQYGWGQVVGNNTTTVSDTITFPTAFTTVLGMTVTHLGAKVGTANDITDLGVNPSVNSVASLGSITTTGATVILSRGANYGNTAYYGYSWIAWGI